MLAVPRHEFVPAELRSAATRTGCPSATARPSASPTWSRRLEPAGCGRAPGAEIGTGCGYQTALLAQLGATV
jgi:protein-L-isoaspartate O-methyltransferase